MNTSQQEIQQQVLADNLAMVSRHEVTDKQPGKMYVQLLHGRKTVDEELDDWGYDGPCLGPIEWMHITYNNTLNIKFCDEDEPTDICLNERDGIRFSESSKKMCRWCALCEFLTAHTI